MTYSNGWANAMQRAHDDITAADFAALEAARREQAVADMPTLAAINHTTVTRVKCEWHGGGVYRYHSTPDGARHYCRSCVSTIRRLYMPKDAQ